MREQGRVDLAPLKTVLSVVRLLVLTARDPEWGEQGEALSEKAAPPLTSISQFG
jgi:hypothetical protein